MNCVRSEKNGGPNKTRPLNLTRRAAQCSISETYIRKRGHVGACGKPFQTGNFSPEKGIGDSAPSRSRLGPGVKEAESLGGRRQPRRSRWHSEADGRLQAEAPPFRSQVSAFSIYAKVHKSMGLEYFISGYSRFREMAYPRVKLCLPFFTASSETEVLFHPGGSCFAIPPGFTLGDIHCCSLRSRPNT